MRVVGDDGTALAPGHIGAVEVRGPNVFAAYWRMPDKTREEFTGDGFFKTGDMGEWVADGPGKGYLRLVGRAKDLIITGGLNVYPKEIEERIDEMDGVVETAIIGIPDPDFGESVTAVVVARSGHALTEGGIISALKADIASFKVPKRVHFVDDLPRNAMGKVQKNVLRERFGPPGQVLRRRATRVVSYPNVDPASPPCVTRTAQYLNSGIFPNGSSTGLVSRFAAAS